MDESSILCIGGVLFGLSHPSYVDQFVYTDTATGNLTKYTKKILHGHMFFVADTIDRKFAEQLAVLVLGKL